MNELSTIQVVNGRKTCKVVSVLRVLGLLQKSADIIFV